jgi:hypothetical protein
LWRLDGFKARELSAHGVDSKKRGGYYVTGENSFFGIVAILYRRD